MIDTRGGARLTQGGGGGGGGERIPPKCTPAEPLGLLLLAPDRQVRHSLKYH